MPSHSEKRFLPYRPEQIYDLVADIERYPEFLPWCVGLRIIRREGDTLFADLLIGFKMVREKFTSRVALTPHSRIDVTYMDGPFRYLENRWIFESRDGGCEIDFFIDFEFRSRILSRLIGPLFHETVRRMVSAFEARARALYGAAESGAPAAAT